MARKRRTLPKRRRNRLPTSRRAPITVRPVPAQERPDADFTLNALLAVPLVPPPAAVAEAQAPLYGWHPPAPSRSGPAVKFILRRSPALSTSAVHALLALCVHRLETTNQFAANQFLRDYASFCLGYPSVRVVEGAALGDGAVVEWANAFFAEAWKQKVITSKKHEYNSTEAVRALALGHYARVRREVDQAQRFCSDLPAREATLAMSGAVRWMLGQITGDAIAFDGALVDNALSWSPSLAARAIVERAFPSVNLASRIKKDRGLTGSPRVRWTLDHVPL